jgi:hypothetical protein
MKSPMRSFLVCTSSAIAIALLAFSFSVGGIHAVRADDPESLSLPVQGTVLVPVKDVQALQQRVAYLEEAVAALTESSQHINTHRLCVSDDGGTETCMTKAQLDLLISRGVVEVGAPAAIAGDAKMVPSAELVTAAVAPDNSESVPSAVPNEASQKDQEPGEAGTITVTSNSELKRAREELFSVVSAAAAEDNAGSKTVELFQDGQPAQAGAETSGSAIELNVVPEHEMPTGGDLP